MICLPDIHTLFSNFSINKTAFITESRFGDTFDVDKCCTSQYMCVIFFCFNKCCTYWYMWYVVICFR